MTTIELTIRGDAKPAGSKRAMARKGGKPFVIDANPDSREWKNLVRDAAAAAMTERYDTAQGRSLLDCAVEVTFTFYRPRPAGHYGATGLNAKGRATPYPSTRPDVLKLARGVEDALTGTIWTDDARIVTETLLKRWGEPARVEITITEAR